MKRLSVFLYSQILGKKIKEENEWFIGEKRVINMDTKVSKLKNKLEGV